MTQSMRGRRGRDHAPAALTYVGRLVVEKNPSGRTPSAGAGSKRASGALEKGGASKLGGRYWKRALITDAKVTRAQRPHATSARHSTATGSRSTITPPRPPPPR